MYTSYAHVGLVNYQYFNGNPWKDAMVTDQSLFLHLPKRKRKSINRQWIHCKKLSYCCTPKAMRNFPMITSRTPCSSKSLAAIISPVRPQCILGPALCCFDIKYDLISNVWGHFLRCTQVWKWEHRKFPRTARCAEATIIWHAFARPNKTYMYTIIQKWYWFNFWNYNWYNRNYNTGMKTTSFILSRDWNNGEHGLPVNGVT